MKSEQLLTQRKIFEDEILAGPDCSTNALWDRRASAGAAFVMACSKIPMRAATSVSPFALIPNSDVSASSCVRPAREMSRYHPIDLFPSTRSCAFWGVMSIFDIRSARPTAMVRAAVVFR